MGNGIDKKGGRKCDIQPRIDAMFEDLRQYAEKRRAKIMAGRKSKHDPLRQMIYRRFQGEINPNDF